MSVVFSPAEVRVLDGLRLRSRKAFTGRVRGERLTRRKGVSIEFADYREYSEGDDLRHLDWNVLARLQVPVIKTYADEEDLAVYVVVDLTPSMGFGEPSKAHTAKKLACALGYVALNSQDAAYPVTVPLRANPEAGHGPFGPAYRGRKGILGLRQWAEKLPASASGELSASLRDFAKSRARPGIVMLLTDGLDPTLATQIRVLGGRGHEVWLVQILSPEELDPDIEGDLRLIDSETGSPVEITANRDALARYKQNLEAHRATLAEACLSVGGRYALVCSDQDLKFVVRECFHRNGWFES